MKDILVAQAHGYVGLEHGDAIGSDLLGTWDGHWYYQNSKGKLAQRGLEAEVKYQLNNYTLSASHSHVRIANDGLESQTTYALPGDKTAAYPEDVTRFILHSDYSTSLGLINLNYNHLYYWQYYAPTIDKMSGEHIASLGLSWQPVDYESSPLTVSLIINNLWQADNLYPINVTGSLSGSEGTPTIEERTWWLKLQYEF